MPVLVSSRAAAWTAVPAPTVGTAGRRGRGEAGRQPQPRVVDRVDHALGGVGVAGASAHRNVVGHDRARAGQGIDRQRGHANDVQGIADCAPWSAAGGIQRQVDEDIAVGRAAAVGHGAAGVAHVGGGQRADVQIVDRRAGRRGVAGVDVGVGVEDRLLVVGGGRADVRRFPTGSTGTPGWPPYPARS